MKKIIISSLFILISFSSCSDVSDFLFETEQNIQIRSIDSGYILKGGESFPVTIEYDREIVPDEFSVTIFDDSGTFRGETILEFPLIEGKFETSLLVPDELPQGKYIFHIRVFESGKEISFKEVIIFKSDKDLSITQLYSLPHQTLSNKIVQISAEIKSSLTIDPFLRWSLNGLILKEGYLSEGLDSLNWLSDEENGLYSIKLEVFPESCDASLQSSVFDFAEIIVSDQFAGETGSLTPDDLYSLLFHFSGDLKLANDLGFEVVESGELQPESIDNRLGYSFTEQTGLFISGESLPVRSGQITPFSISGRVLIPGIFTGGNLITISESQKPILSLSIDNSGYLDLLINGELSKSRFTLFEMTDFTLSIIPDENGIGVRWFYNGIAGGSDFLQTNFKEIISEQMVVLGGSETLSGADVFIDELGIFTGKQEQSSVDGNQFVRVKKHLLGDNFIAADGFDSIEKDGFLKVLPGDVVLLDTFVKSINDTDFVISFPERSPENLSDSWELFLTDQDGVSLFSFTDRDVVKETDLITGFVSEKIRFSLIIKKESIELVSKNDESLNKVIKGLKPGDIVSL
nr:hypothetical protein [Spirochaetaceae bacterium]